MRRLHEESYSSPQLTAVYGRSAGGMAAAMFTNLWPQMAQAAILQVSMDKQFVIALITLLGVPTCLTYTS